MTGNSIPAQVTYISLGNIPSRWAHTVQMMKMSEALAQEVGQFELVTQVHWRNCWKRRFDFESWYGILHPFRIKTLITRCAHRDAVATQVFSIPFAEAAVRYVEKQRPDLVITRCHHAAEKLAAGSIPFIYETHSRDGEQLDSWLIPIAGSPMLRGVVTIAESLVPRYCERGISEDKIAVLEDAVDFDRWQQVPSQNVARRQLGLPGDAFIAVYCGHLYEHRGIEDIMDAAAVRSDVEFVLVGGRPEDVEKRKEEAAHLPNVSFTGFVPNTQVPLYAAASDCILIPYSADLPQADIMSPLKLFESMATSRPIIASDLPAIRKHLNKENALLVAPDSGEAIAAALSALHSGSIDGRKLALAALDAVRPHTWRVRAQQMLKLAH